MFAYRLPQASLTGAGKHFNSEYLNAKIGLPTVWKKLNACSYMFPRVPNLARNEGIVVYSSLV